MRYFKRLPLLAFVLLTAALSSVGYGQDISTLLMQITFEIKGPGAPGTITTGTVFIMGKQQKDDPTKAYFVLITAAHVLDEIQGEDAVLMLRKKNNDGTFSPIPFPLKIRRGVEKLYKTDPTADVSAMYVSLPNDLHLGLLPLSLLATDNTLTSLAVHPGDELFCLGFPLGIDFDTFPVIRAGVLASYPLTPSKTIKTFYYNFHVFPGNSGGPVYFSFPNRNINGNVTIGTNQGVVGLVVQQVTSTQAGYESTQIDVSKIVPSVYIIEAIAMLPDTPEQSNSNVNFVQGVPSKP